MKIRKIWTVCCLVNLFFLQQLLAADSFVTYNGNGFSWIQNGKAYPILVDQQEYKGVLRAVSNLQSDANKVTGVMPETSNSVSGSKMLIIGSAENSSWIKKLLKSGKINSADLVGKREKYILQTVKQPFEGVDEAVVIAGSDKRGTIYGIYELSNQMGVSPCHQVISIGAVTWYLDASTFGAAAGVAAGAACLAGASWVPVANTPVKQNATASRIQNVLFIMIKPMSPEPRITTLEPTLQPSMFIKRCAVPAL